MIHDGMKMNVRVKRDGDGNLFWCDTRGGKPYHWESCTESIGNALVMMAARATARELRKALPPDE